MTSRYPSCLLNGRTESKYLKLQKEMMRGTNLIVQNFYETGKLDGRIGNPRVSQRPGGRNTVINWYLRRLPSRFAVEFNLFAIGENFAV